ncbi:hypothetical protein CMI41_02460 [Candidatus Pacearchaeota archaeon]|jgi:phosphoglycolate phosphatase|nr:hypothetical protein [Candidatus Pacearchaeota archaeon]|tara:strand:+ start:3094 stop:3759 length:666 start_codon:yes stop_codon:yes gene_type:complete
MKYDAVIFDVDGTLTDTGKTHVRWCNDQNEKGGYGLPRIDVDDPVAVRGVLGNPMATIIRNYGFPEGEVKNLVTAYELRFGEDARYKAELFPDAFTLLTKLNERSSTNHLPMGLVSSNVEPNIRRDLGCLELFTDWVDKQRMDNEGLTKADAIRSIVELHVSRRPVYIGDTMKDFQASVGAGAAFIGVNYGWEINDAHGEQHMFPVVGSIGELATELDIHL